MKMFHYFFKKTQTYEIEEKSVVNSNLLMIGKLTDLVK